MKKAVVLVALYLAQAVYAYGTFTAEEEYCRHHAWANLDLHQRDDLGPDVFVSALPFGCAVAAIATNFNQHGWELTWREP